MGAGAPAAARLGDPVAHSHALGGFLAGAVVGLVAATAATVVIGAGVAALEVATAGLATPLVIGAAATALEFGAGAYVGGKLMGLAEDEGEKLGSQSMGAPSGQVAQGSPTVFINGRPAARAGDAETCDAGLVAQGSKIVTINGRPASRVGDKTSCGGQIVQGSANVFIGGPPVSVTAIQSEVPEWVRWATVVVSILPALGQAARAIGPALAEIEATGFARAAQTGVKALGRAMEERAGTAAARAGLERAGAKAPDQACGAAAESTGTAEAPAIGREPPADAMYGRPASDVEGPLGHPEEPHYDHNAVTDPGSLADLRGQPAGNFFGGKYNTNVAAEDMTLYRAGDSQGKGLGQWFTRTPPESVAKVRIDSAVKPQWIDPKTGLYTGESPIDAIYNV